VTRPEKSLRFLFFLKRWKFFKNNFVLRWLSKLFDKALVCALVCGALAMCLQNALPYIHFLSRI